MVRLCAENAPYHTYATHERIDAAIGQGLSQRHDAVMNFVRTGGIARADEPPEALTVRTSYFREEYAYGNEERAPGIGPFLHLDAFVEAARAVHGRDVVEPAIVYANLMVPGQEHAVHTDVPEFRGINRKLVPQWLLVVMQHSGLFDAYRMPIATAIAWFHECDGGELVFWPDGADAPMQRYPAGFNTAMVLDTDRVFHGVDRVADVPASDLPPIRRGATLQHDGRGAWSLHDRDGTVLRQYRWEQLRFSVSWKAYCFSDDAERDAWREHRDDLSLDTVVDRLVADLCERDVVAADVARDGTLGQLLIDEYVRFPVSTSSSTR